MTDFDFEIFVRQPRPVCGFLLRQPNAVERHQLTLAENVIFRGLTRDLDSRDLVDVITMLSGAPRWLVRIRLAIHRAICRQNDIVRVWTDKQLHLAQLTWNHHSLAHARNVRGY